MTKRKEYTYGEIIGKHGIEFISDYNEDGSIITPYIYTMKDGSKRNFRRARFKCPICRKEFITRIDSVQSGNTKRCDECYRKILAEKNKEHFQIGDYVDSNHNFIYLEEAGYNSSHKRKIRVIKQSTGEIFDTTVNNIKTGCTTRGPKELKKFRQDLIQSDKVKNARFAKTIHYHPGDILGPDNNILFVKDVDRHRENVRRGLFRNLWTEIKFEANIASVISGEATGNKISKGELKLLLSVYSLDPAVESQKMFDGLVSPDGYSLRIDAFSPKYNCCFEFDGEQHYRAIKKWGGQEGYLKRQQYDNIKNNYCQEHQIKMVRIPYYDYNILNSDYLLAKIG